MLEAALMGLLWGIATNPERYGKVTANIWLARSRSFHQEHPSLKIFFGIPNEKEILLMWIEEISGTEEIEMGMK